MVNTKCECGHNNPVGTTLCEYCGKPLDEGNEDQPLEMRYEGKARRSQTQNQTVLDWIWNFFSSVKVAIYLIVITLVTSVLGTILPQERFIPSNRPEIYYAQEYGIWGELFYRLGLSDMYNSWWYIALLSMIGISLVVCSLDRVVPLYKALKNQRVIKNTTFIRRQRVSRSQPVPEEEKEAVLDRLAHTLSKKRYHVRREEDSILAEKGRFSRWGPYVNHIGLIIFLFGTLMRLIPGWYLDDLVFLQEGETKKLPDVPYHVKNERAFAELYDEDEMPQQLDEMPAIVKKYETRVTLYEEDPETGELREVKRDSILVNHPLKHEGLLLFQSGFEPNQAKSITLSVEDRKQDQELGTIQVDLYDPKTKYELENGVTIRILNYFPDFVLEDNQPATKSEIPNRPAFIFSVDSPDLDEPEKSWMISGTNLDDVNEANRYGMSLEEIETVNTSVLMVRMDKSLPVIFFGLGIFMVGLSMGLFWFHRRVWIRWEEGNLLMGAHTNKNWFGLRKELEQATEKADTPLNFSPEQPEQR
ncbi:cytochrome c biogenesis protein ResB [Desmospora profundinema]|uniref:Cytochrome c biogenesis protein n=1 Tax=Desmospora profundinema TaxID=1571184 RepID=A0ABU1IIE4_9BACL|nr:cytochrome c biogenesis protein ResB [Desmospora profundinema]MDR6224547.1 cytochrome c biogenesis protein [Desmospora profundinema]